jgi:tetratricopeptide (TPR) repeat protein
MPMPRPSPTILPSALLAALLLAACGSSSVIQESRHLARRLEYERAFSVLDEEYNRQVAAGDEPDEDLKQAHREAWLAWLLERARLAIFQEREMAALEDLALLEELSPNYPEIQNLRARANVKLAERAVEEGDLCLVNRDIQAALAHYLEAQKFRPGYPPAVEGTDKVREALSKLSLRAQNQFLEAVRKLPEFRYVEVRWHADIAATNDPERVDAQELELKARHEMAIKTQERGSECFDDGQFGAALLHFKQAKTLEKSLPGIDAEIESATREMKAIALMESAQMSMRSERFDSAREQLAKALESSTHSRDAIHELMLEVNRLEGKARYRKARDLEILGKKVESLAAFEELSASWPDGLLDEKARIEGLRLDIETAEAEYAAAEKAEADGDPAAALQHYETALQFVPRFRDAEARAKKLRAKVGQPGPQ